MKYIIYLLVPVAILTGCKSEQEKTEERIATLEQVDTGVSHLPELAALYMDYVNRFNPDSTTRAAYLSRSAAYYQQFEEYDNALKCYAMLRRHTGDSVYLVSAQAPMEAFAYAKLGKADSAIMVYEQIARLKPLQATSTVELADLYLAKAKTASDPEARENAHLKAARLLAHSGDSRQALRELTTFYQTYKESDKAPYAMFEAANILEQQFNNIDSARSVLESLIERYPEDPFANDARIYLEKDLLGKSDLEKLKIITGENPS